MLRYAITATAVVMTSLFASPAAAAQEMPRGAAAAPEFRLHGDTVSIPS